MISDILKRSIADALAGLGIEKAAFSVEHPDDLSHGDYSTNAAMAFAKELKAKPRELAEKLVAILEKSKPAEVERIDIAGPGFINFHLKRDFFAEEVAKILKEKGKFGSSTAGKGKKILVEYSSPNIAKPFTVGHLRSTVIGDALANILAFSGWKVTRDNHLGDWGTQFGKLTVALDMDENHNPGGLDKAKDKMEYLVDLYVKFHHDAEIDPGMEDRARENFMLLERGDKTKIYALYEKILGISMEYFAGIYKRLNVTPFDTQHGEHFYEPYVSKVKKALEEKDLLKESEGAKLVFFPDEKYPPFMIEKKDGTTLYATRDLATDLWRRDEYGKDTTIINEVGIEQSLHFRQLFEVEETLGWFAKGRRIHVAHGHYRFKDGKMSTRKGNVIWLEDIIDEAVRRAGEINPATAEAVGIGSIKFNDLKRESIQDIVFDWDEALSLRGDSCPYLQYSYARAKSILEKAREAGIEASPKPASESRADPLEKMLCRFPEIVLRSSAEYKPQYVAAYLLDLAGAFNAFYGSTQIVNKEDAASAYRVALVEAFSIIVKTGLALLGIQVPERM